MFNQLIELINGLLLNNGTFLGVFVVIFLGFSGFGFWGCDGSYGASGHAI